MTEYEKLAEDYANEGGWSADKFKGYLAGFLKAREMIADYFERSSKMWGTLVENKDTKKIKDPFSDYIRTIGEREV